jgi:hypothetical protein
MTTSRWNDRGRDRRLPAAMGRMRFAVSAVSLVSIAVAAGVQTTAGASGAQDDRAPSPVIYSEPDDPAEDVLRRAVGRLDPVGRPAAEAVPLSLRELDEAIANLPPDPWLLWHRARILDRVERTAEARTAREEAIRVARVVPGADELLPDYYREHAEACAWAIR